MPFFRPKHPLVKALAAFGSALVYLLSIPFVRKYVLRLLGRPLKNMDKGKIVDARGTVVDE